MISLINFVLKKPAFDRLFYIFMQCCHFDTKRTVELYETCELVSGAELRCGSKEPPHIAQGDMTDYFTYALAATFIVLAIISLKLSAFNEAPPTKAPSMSDFDICSAIVEGLTEPP